MIYCILTCCLLPRKLLHNWEDYDSSSSTWTLNSYLDKYRSLEACQGKNIMICRNCNAAVSDASLAVLGHYHYRIWCFGRGSFVRIPEVRQIVTSVESTLRLRASVVFLHCVRLCQTDIQEMSLLRRMFLQKEGDILYPWAHSGERANDEIERPFLCLLSQKETFLKYFASLPRSVIGQIPFTSPFVQIPYSWQQF